MIESRRFAQRRVSDGSRLLPWIMLPSTLEIGALVDERGWSSGSAWPPSVLEHRQHPALRCGVRIRSVAASASAIGWFATNRSMIAAGSRSVGSTGGHNRPCCTVHHLSLIHISEPTRLLSISYAVFCLKKK